MSEDALWLGLNTLPEDKIPSWIRSLPSGERTLQLLLQMADHLYGGNKPIRALRVAETCREVARERGLRKLEADSLTRVGRSLAILGEETRSETALQEALALHRELGDRAGQAWDLMEMGMPRNRRREHPEALGLFREALELARGAGDRWAEANTLWRASMAHAALKNDGEALKGFQRALEIYRSLGNRTEEARCLRNIADVHWVNDRNQEAERLYRAALRLDRRWNPEGAATDLMGLGEIEVERGRLLKALECFEEAEDLYGLTGCLDGEARALSREGMVLFELKEFDDALESLRTAAIRHLELGDARNEALAYAVMGAIYMAQGDTRRADAMGGRAVGLYPGVMEELGKQTERGERRTIQAEPELPLYG